MYRGPGELPVRGNNHENGDHKTNTYTPMPYYYTHLNTHTTLLYSHTTLLYTLTPMVSVLRILKSTLGQSKIESTHSFLVRDLLTNFWVLIHDNFSRDKIFLDWVPKLVSVRTHQMVDDALVKSLPSPAFVGHQQIMTGHVPCTAALLRCFGGQFLALILSAVFLCFGSIDCLRYCFLASYSASGFFRAVSDHDFVPLL